MVKYIKQGKKENHSIFFILIKLLLKCNGKILLM